jgi:hypothetical protein
MHSTLQKLAVELDAADFDRRSDADSFNEIHQKLTFYARTHYAQYIPTMGVDSHDFETRLLHWLYNPGVTDEHRKTLFRLAPKIVFFNREDFTKLHQAAIDGPVVRWIVETLDLNLASPGQCELIDAEIQNHTWFTSITDSMQIADFHHANNVGGMDLRPDWRSLAKFGDVSKISDFMRNHTDTKGRPQPIQRIVILEDFVGSGTQMSMDAGSISFAARNFPHIPILLAPLIICPVGANAARTLAAHYKNVTFEPILELRADDFFVPTMNAQSGTFEHDLLQLAFGTYPLVVGDGAAYPRPYGPFGFPGNDPTGAIVVMHSNTPANSLPLIHHGSNTWDPLFPRSARLR